MSGRGRCSSQLPSDHASALSVSSSCGYLLAFRRPPFLLLAELIREPIKAGFPQAAILRDPGVELLKGLWSKRVHPPRSIGTDLDEPRFVQDPEMPRDAGLADVNGLYDVVHSHLAISKRLDDPTARGVGQGLEDALGHERLYTHTRI